MKATFLSRRTVNRWLLISAVALLAALIVGLGSLVAACGGKETTTTIASATTQAPTSTTQAVTTTEAVATTQTVATTQSATTIQAVTTTEAATTTTQAGPEIDIVVMSPIWPRHGKDGIPRCSTYTLRRRGDPGPWW